ncbi:hypothetical protein D3C71_2176780 [compost metagenome]
MVPRQAQRAAGSAASADFGIPEAFGGHIHRYLPVNQQPGAGLKRTFDGPALEARCEFSARNQLC